MTKTEDRIKEALKEALFAEEQGERLCYWTSCEPCRLRRAAKQHQNSAAASGFKFSGVDWLKWAVADVSRDSAWSDCPCPSCDLIRLADRLTSTTRTFGVQVADGDSQPSPSANGSSGGTEASSPGSAGPAASSATTDEPAPSPSEGFVKYDGDKPRTDLLPPEALLEVARVLGFGAKKYSDNGWKSCPNPNRYVAAALRHTFAHLSGKVTDDESGASHLAHAATSILIALELLLAEGPAGAGPE